MIAKNKAAKNSVALPALIIDEAQYRNLINVALDASERNPQLATQLLGEIERAEIKPSAEVPTDVVRVGSRVTFRDGDSGRTRTVELVYPRNADIDRQRISLLAPIGVALLGLSVGQQILWEMSNGRLKPLTVLAVERGGDATAGRPDLH